MVIEALIKANSKKSVVFWDQDIKKFVVYVKSPPTKGKANKEVSNLLKDYFKASAIVLIKGFSSTTKFFEIKGAKDHIKQ